MRAGDSVGRASALIASGTIVSRGLGFLKALVLAAAIGTVGAGADGYAVATYVPNSIYAIIAGGLLTSVLVPQIVRASRAPDGGAAYINKLVTIALLLLAAVALVATLAAPVLMPLFTRADSATLSLTVAFAFWSLPQIFFLGLYAVLGEVLVARRSFGPYMWAPVVNNVVAIASLVLFLVVFGQRAAFPAGAWHADMIAVVGGGATLGIATQAAVLVLAWRRVGLRYRPDFRWRGVHLAAAGSAAAWSFGMLIVNQVGGAVETNVASLASGDAASNATMTMSWLVFMLPHSIVTVSLVTVFYPRMSEGAAAGDLPLVREQVGQALRIVLLPLTGASVALIAIAIPVARVFAHTPSAASAMAPVLIGYLVGLVPFTALFVLQRCFFALADTRTPFFYTVTQTVIVIAGVLACSLLPVDRIAAAIAFTVSAGALAQLGIAAVLLRRRIGGMGGRAVTAAVLRYLLAAVPALAIGELVTAVLLAALPVSAVTSVLAAIGIAFVGGVVAFAVYLLALRVLRSPELATAAGMVTSRLTARRAATPK